MNRSLKKALKKIGLSKQDPTTEGSIKNDYYRACAEAGELQYKIGEYQKALVEVNKRIQELNLAYTEVLSEARAKQGAAQAQVQGQPAAPSPQEPTNA